MKQRIFIAINLPENIKKELRACQERIDELFTSYRPDIVGAGAGPVRWIKPENLHITLVFLGHISDEELPKILKIVNEVAERYSPFPINLTKICYGPPKKIPPRLVWIEGEKSEELGKLQQDLEESLFSGSVKSLRTPETRIYVPHITLGRIRVWEFRQIEPEERPMLNENISLNFEVNSIELMESQLKRGGSEYTILESFELKSHEL